MLNFIKSFFYPKPIPTPTSSKKEVIKDVPGTQREPDYAFDLRGKKYLRIETDFGFEDRVVSGEVITKKSDLDKFDLYQIENPLPKKPLKESVYLELKTFWAAGTSAGGVVAAKKGQKGYSATTVEKYWSAINRANVERLKAVE